MEEINLIKDLEKISYIGFSSSTTHQIKIDSEKQVIEFDQFFTISY